MSGVAAAHTAAFSRSSAPRPPLRPRASPCCCSADAAPGASAPQPSCSPRPACSTLGRRAALRAGLAAAAAPPALLLFGPAARAASLVPPPGFRRVVDKIEGYSFFAPSSWLTVTTAGAEAFFRSPDNLEENFFVEISSPSSTKYATVEDLGSPEAAAVASAQKYLTEFMSTRIGVRRETSVAAARRTTLATGQAAYETDVRITSIVNNNQLAVTPGERKARGGEARSPERSAPLSRAPSSAPGVWGSV